MLRAARAVSDNAEAALYVMYVMVRIARLFATLYLFYYEFKRGELLFDTTLLILVVPQYYRMNCS